MDLILPMFFLELGVAFLIVSLLADKIRDYNDIVPIFLILSIVTFFVGGFAMMGVTETVTSSMFNESSGVWVNNTFSSRTGDYDWLGMVGVGLAFFSLTLLFLKIISKYGDDE